MKAAICYEFKKPLVVEDIEIDPPGKGEVKIRMAATAICHSDIHLINGDFFQDLPIVAGHESAGYVEEVGEGVTSVKPGDQVALTTVFSCGKCKSCSKGYPHMCDHRMQTDIKGHIRNKKGQTVFTMSMVAGFADHTIAKESQLVKIPDDVPSDCASLLSCGVITGFGAVVNRARVQPFSSVVVIGTGGVGLNSIQGAALSGAYPVIAVDILDSKLEATKIFGATHTVNAKKDDPVEKVKEITGGWGAEYVFTTVAKNDVIRQCVAMSAKRGKTVLIGVPEAGETFTLSPFELLDDEKVLTACFMGSTKLNVDIPRLVSMYQDGRYKLNELITGRYPLEQINEAIESVLKGEALRNVIVY